MPPIVIKLSRVRSVGRSVYLSNALWKNGGSDPDAVWHHRSDASRDEAWFGDRPTGRDTFGVEFEARHCKNTNGEFTPYCETMPQPSKMRFGVMLAVGRGIAVLDGVYVVQREGEVLGVWFPFSQWEMPLGRRR